jgi:hypothetical protein
MSCLTCNVINRPCSASLIGSFLVYRKGHRMHFRHPAIKTGEHATKSRPYHDATLVER